LKIIPAQLAGSLVVQPFFAKDECGTFVKIYHEERFTEWGLPTIWCEEFYSSSRKGVIREIHFQTPPHDHEKIVYCMQGRVLGMVLDMRSASSTYNQRIAFELDSAKGAGLIIPHGVAPFFLALTDGVLMAYKLTLVYTRDTNVGIRWDYFGLYLDVDSQVYLVRNSSLPPFKISPLLC
jgi:dTDP-4-dehydrorhamnose 3,5-epimerase